MPAKIKLKFAFWNKAVKRLDTVYDSKVLRDKSVDLHLIRRKRVGRVLSSSRKALFPLPSENK